MSDCLLVLNPRHIAECVEAIEALPIPKVWLSRYTEVQLETAMPEAIRETGYDRYLVLSDDTVPTPEALGLVTDLLDLGHPVATGYCNIDTTRMADRVNLLLDDPVGSPFYGDARWPFPARTQVDEHRLSAIRTSFAGYTLTGMGREMWERFPHRALRNFGEGGCCSDHMLCWRLQRAGVPVVAARGAFVHHVKERWSVLDRDPAKRLLLHEPSVTRHDPAFVGAAA